MSLAIVIICALHGCIVDRVHMRADGTVKETCVVCRKRFKR